MYALCLLYVIVWYVLVSCVYFVEVAHPAVSLSTTVSRPLSRSLFPSLSPSLSLFLSLSLSLSLPPSRSLSLSLSLRLSQSPSLDCVLEERDRAASWMDWWRGRIESRERSRRSWWIDSRERLMNTSWLSLDGVDGWVESASSFESGLGPASWSKELAEHCWDSTVWNLVLDETVPPCFACASISRPVIGLLEPQKFDEVSNRILLTSHWWL